MDLLEVANRRSAPGVLIFNHCQEPIFFNPVALTILSKLNGNYSSSPPHKAIGVSIPHEIYNLYEDLKKGFLDSLVSQDEPMSPKIVLFSTPEATYCCRGFALHTGENGSSEKTFHIMMLIEKISQFRQIDFDKLKKRFQLTGRQVEIIRHLFAGLTNKQIADRLFVSEDTIKGHLKHIMRRLRVNSRTEILSMILQL